MYISLLINFYQHGTNVNMTFINFADIDLVFFPNNIY